MTTAAPETRSAGREVALDSLPGRADKTRQALLASARRRFALDGYRTTTVRDIAADAGVNVALINRYFDSKEGLFEACLTHASNRAQDQPEGTLEQTVQAMTDRVAASPGSEDSLNLVLLLRTSGDLGADAIRRKTLRLFAERLAVHAGWVPEKEGGDELLLRAEIAISMALGFALLRTSSGLEPLTSASTEVVSSVMNDAFFALLSLPDARQP